jgi:docosahexaenoic acid omega-hydroxylase
MYAVLYTSILVVASTVALFAYLKRRKLHKLVDKIPGPKPVPFFGNSLIFEKDSDAFYKQIENLCHHHIDTGICRVWIGQQLVILVYRADLLETFFNGSKHISKSFIYKFLDPWLGNGLLNSTGPKWFKRRRMITPSFHYKILEDFLDVMNEQAKILGDIFDSKVGGEAFNVQDYLAHCALDIISETASGRRINAQQGEKSPYVEALYGASADFFHRLNKPWLWPHFLHRLHPSGRAYAKNLKVLKEFTTQVIKERSAEFDRVWEKHQGGKTAAPGDSEIPIRIGKRMVILDMLLLAAKTDESITKEAIQEEVDTFMFEGHDTTATTMAWGLYHIGRHPEVQAKLHNEVDRIFGDDDRPVTMDDINQLKYLDSFLKESMRVIPTVPLYGREVSEDCEMGGYFVPKKATVLFMTAPLHRDPKYFPEPDKLDPDRWVTDNPTDKHPFAYVPFSAGVRNCIGQRFAIIEEKVVLSHLLRRFTVTCTDPDEPGRTGFLVMRPVNGVHITLERRNA